VKIPRLVFAVAATASAVLAAPPAQAAACPDIDVVFARGTFEPPGVSRIGQAFVDAVTSAAGTKTVNVYPVNYPASTDWFTAAEGVMDASNHIRTMAANCPHTKIVLGGYSADHIAAVALFGKPSAEFLNSIGAPPITIGPLYAAKTIDLCIADDPVCSDGGGNGAAHGMYAADGMVGQAAQFAVKRV
jgi:cutinase